ncbi:MAG: hypothetical protein K2P65_08310 [Lachnospiraceae bacterium]|nr:hypothetical protein [Lachnospiraceae bacterium]
MKKVNKLIALSLAGAMVISTPVLAAPSPSVSSSSGSSITAEEAAQIAAEVSEKAAEAALVSQMAQESQANALAAEASGIPMATSIAASAEGKTPEEYMNNAVTEVQGLEEATPVAQGGHVIINGAPSNQSFSVQKPYLAEVNSAKSQAATLGGKVLNVARINAGVSFDTATVNFYMPGVKAGNNIQVYQLVDGQWTSVTVSEVRADHVVVDMTSLGTIAFIEVAAQ